MKVVVTGSRHWTDRRAIMRRLLELPEGTLIMHGSSGNADWCANEVAGLLGLPTKGFPAQWDRYKKQAGPIRNRKMLDEKPDLVLAFRKGGPKLSPGTTDCGEEAERRGIPVEWEERP